MTTAAVPSLIHDGAAIGAFILTAAGVGALIVRAIKHTIRDEVPKAMADAIPDVTRHMVRDEVARAVDPVLAELRPNGGSSAFDRLSKRIDSLESGQADLMDAITTPTVTTPVPRKRTAKK